MGQSQKEDDDGGNFFAPFVAPKVRFCPTIHKYGIREERHLKVFKMRKDPWTVNNISTY